MDAFVFGVLRLLGTLLLNSAHILSVIRCAFLISMFLIER